jgi:hypothetical protein
VETEQVERLTPRIAWFYDQTATPISPGKIKLNMRRWPPPGLIGLPVA